MTLLPPDSPAAIALDIAAVRRVSAVPALLNVICDFTGLGFAAVARVTAGTWTACAVQDNAGFGLKPGDQLDIGTTLCREVRDTGAAVVIDHASDDPGYCGHETPRLYGFESYISVPIVRRNGTYFGNLCALDAKPADLRQRRTLAMFELYAQLIALQLDSEEAHDRTEADLANEREYGALREEFIAVLGHDLRNPLAAIHGCAELLIRRQAEPQAAKMGLRLRAAAQRMAGLIGDVMDFARGRLGGGIGVTTARVDDLQDALRHVIDESRAAHPERAVEDRLAISGPVVCDRARMQQLLSNLLGNAMHHGSADQPVVVEGRVSSSWVEISVRNGGAPIPAEHFSKLFEPYWRASNRQAGEGLGLGLYICRHIVHAHGGTLAVASDAVNGTCFTARLPAG